jgi:hypothetical protein
MKRDTLYYKTWEIFQLIRN